MKRQLGLFDSTMIMVGMVIGSAIFLSTGIIAASIPSPGLILLAWLAGGLLTLAGAMTYAELGASIPKAGGQYVYIKMAYGELPAFLFGWVFFFAYMTGSVAVLAIAFSEYLGFFLPALSPANELFLFQTDLFGAPLSYSLSAGQIVGIAIIVVFSAVNYIGVRLGKVIQNIVTVAKIGAILVFIMLALVAGKGELPDLTRVSGEMEWGQLVVGFGVALIAVSWTFDGWNNINFVAGEMRNPQRNLTRTLIVGTILITAIYLAVNIVYLIALPISEISGEYRVAEKAASALWGPIAASLISGAVLISIMGALNGTILSGARVYYAMALDGLFFRGAGEVHPRFETPAFAIVIQALWSVVLLLSGNLEQIVTFSIFIAIVFWIVAAASVFTLRKKFPDLPRPYKVWGFPYVPIVFIVASVGILINTLIDKPFESLAGLILIVLGLPVFLCLKARRNRAVHDASHTADEGKVQNGKIQ